MNTEFFIKLREMVSSGLVKMADTARKTTSAMTGTNNTLSQSYDTIKRKVQDLENTISRSSSVRQIRDARTELEKLQRVSMRHIGNTGSGGGFFAGGLRSVLPALGIAGALAMGGSSLSSGLTAQARQTSFEVMAGKTEGTRLNKDLTKYAQDSIYGSEVYQNAQTMLGFGAGSKDVMPDLKMIGDIAMGDKDKMGRLTLAFSQVRAAGKLMGQDLLQFINAGFNPLQIVSQKTGISLGVLRERMSEGAISFEMVKEAFQSATGVGGRFYDMTNKIAQTDFGKWEAFKGQVAGLGMQVGGMLAPVLGSLITNVLAPLVGWLSEVAKWVQENSSWIGFLASTIGGAIVAFQSVIMVTRLWAAAQVVLNAVLTANPIGLVIAAVGALVAGVIYAWNNFEGFRQTILSLWEVFKTVFTNIGEFFKKIFDPIFEAITAFKEGRYADAALATGKVLYALSPIGLAENAISFAKEGGFTKGIAEAWQRGQERGKNTTETSAAADAATPGGGKFASSFAGIDADSTARGVAGGGPRIININGVKFAEKIEIHTATLEKGLDGIKDQLDEYFLRLLNSGAAVQ